MPTGHAVLKFPNLEVAGAGTSGVVDWLGICLNLANLAPTQYANLDFNSMCQFGDVFLAANATGIFSLDTSDSDNGTPIDAFFELPLVDLQMARIRSVHVGYETDGVIRLAVQADDGEVRYWVLSPIRLGDRDHSNKITVGRDRRGRYWLFRIENVDGSDFSIDAMTIYPVLLGPRRSNSR